MTQLSPSQTKEFVINALKCKEIPYVSGPPGIGKSDIMVQVAKEFNLKILDIRLSQMLPEDLTGLPSMSKDGKRAEYTPFDTFPLESDTVPKGYNGWLIFLDELSSCSEEVMAAIYSLLLGRRIGNKQIHEKALIVAAGNKSSDSAIARELPDTLITRMLPCEMKTNAKDWVLWATDVSNNGNESVVSFIQKHKDMLFNSSDPSKRQELETYATPRGWGKVFTILNMHEKESKKDNKHQMSILKEDTIFLIEAAVGVLATQSFVEHYNEVLELPFPWDVAQSPKSTKIPVNSVGRIELTENLAEHFLNCSDESRDSLYQFMNRMGKEERTLFSKLISEKLGTSKDDINLVHSINTRLNVHKYGKINLVEPEEPEYGYQSKKKK